MTTGKFLKGAAVNRCCLLECYCIYEKMWLIFPFINSPLLPLSFSHYKSMEANDTWGVVNVDPRGLVVKIYVGDH